MLARAIDPGRDAAEGGARRIDDDDRQATGRGQLGPLGIREHGHGAALRRVCRIARTVASEPLHADEQVAGLHLGGTQGDPGYLDAVK